MSTAQRIFEKLADFYFFQITVVSDFEYKGKTDKNVKQKKNDSILKPENWEQHKETFFNQRMAIYKDSYTIIEKIQLELEALEKLTINNVDYKILKNRYREYLEKKQAVLPQQTETNPKTIETKTEQTETIENPHPRIFPNGKCWQLFENWRNDVKEKTQLAEFSFIYWQMKNDGYIHENIRPTEFRNWMLKTFSINLEPLKQLTVCNGGNKYSRYQSAKLLIKC
jgi:hypothetical protein